MHTLILNHEFPPVGGGAASATAQIARHLSAQGLRVTVMTAGYRNLPERETRDGYTLIRVPAWRRDPLESRPHELLSFLAGAFLRALPFCLRTRPDLIHAFFGIPSGALACVLSRLTDIPYLISFRGRDVHGGKSLDSDGISGILRAVSLPVWKRASALIANSRGLRTIALRVSPGADVGVIPNGIDTGRFTPGCPAPDGPLRLLFVGRLEPYKGLSDLLRALPLIRSPHPYCLRIVGDGSLRDELPRLAAELRLGNRITFSGPIPGEHVPGVYREADLFVLPSTVEGMPNVVLEAMSAGLPVVATRIPGSEELVAPGRTGLLVPPSDPAALAAALETLLRNRALRKNMGTRARQEARARSWDAVAGAYAALYRRILARPVPARPELLSAPASSEIR